MVLLLLLLLLLCQRLHIRLDLLRPSTHLLSLELEVIFGPDCSIDHGVKRLIGDAVGRHAAHLWVWFDK